MLPASGQVSSFPAKPFLLSKRKKINMEKTAAVRNAVVILYIVSIA